MATPEHEVRGLILIKNKKQKIKNKKQKIKNKKQKIKNKKQKIKNKKTKKQKNKKTKLSTFFFCLFTGVLTFNLICFTVLFKITI
jgi:high-affinity Fe2+/Pb2+ permease